MARIIPARIVWKNVVEFFRIPENFEVFYAIKMKSARSKDGKKISLRVIEYMLTNYVVTTERVKYIVANHSEHNQVKILDQKNEDFSTLRDEMLAEGYNLKLFDVRKDYERQITEVYHKKMFDPCCRGNLTNKFMFRGPTQLEVQTSLRQMVFFRWAIENGVCEWLHQNAIRVIEAMRRDVNEKKRLREESNPDYKPRLETLRRKRAKMVPVGASKTQALIDNSTTTMLID